MMRKPCFALLGVFLLSITLFAQTTRCRSREPIKDPRNLLGPSVDPDELSSRDTVFIEYFSRYSTGLIFNKHITLFDTSRKDYSFADGAEEMHLTLSRLYSGRNVPLDFVTLIFESRSKCPMHSTVTPTQLSADGETISSSASSLAQRIDTGFIVIEQSFVDVPFPIVEKWSRSQQVELRFGKIAYSLSTAEVASVRAFVEVVRDLHQGPR